MFNIHKVKFKKQSNMEKNIIRLIFVYSIIISFASIWSIVFFNSNYIPSQITCILSLSLLLASSYILKLGKK